VTLVCLAVSNGIRCRVRDEAMAADHDIEWCVQMRHQVVALLDAAASACMVELSAMDPVSQDHA